MPSKIPNDVLFLQKKMKKIYKKTINNLYPKYALLEKKTKLKKENPNNIVPYSINRNILKGEEKVKPIKAWSNSILIVNFHNWSTTKYHPENVNSN
jgi:hypothetical protein